MSEQEYKQSKSELETSSRVTSCQRDPRGVMATLTDGTKRLFWTLGEVAEWVKVFP